MPTRRVPWVYGFHNNEINCTYDGPYGFFCDTIRTSWGGRHSLNWNSDRRRRRISHSCHVANICINIIFFFYKHKIAKKSWQHVNYGRRVERNKTRNNDNTFKSYLIQYAAIHAGYCTYSTNPIYTERSITPWLSESICKTFFTFFFLRQFV